jgi:hypothetical protein
MFSGIPRFNLSIGFDLFRINRQLNPLSTRILVREGMIQKVVSIGAGNSSIIEMSDLKTRGSESVEEH